MPCALPRACPARSARQARADDRRSAPAHRRGWLRATPVTYGWSETGRGMADEQERRQAGSDGVQLWVRVVATAANERADCSVLQAWKRRIRVFLGFGRHRNQSARKRAERKGKQLSVLTTRKRETHEQATEQRVYCNDTDQLCGPQIQRG